MLWIQRFFRELPWSGCEISHGGNWKLEQRIETNTDLADGRDLERLEQVNASATCKS
jgi:hypothetical protein